ncbi:MAG TPA: SAM-dependent methyltransferase [Streptosporangiaceae bacterium]|nr:SAM-dependent methyltransferase [Streptosporangiaceae bacterium]
MTDDSSSAQQPYPKIDVSVPHAARIWNYWLGGKDHYPVDREAGEQYRATYPAIVDIARQSREFLVRAVGYLAGEAGISQFLDIGTGLPTANNTHEVAQRVNPRARIVYVDNDPLVLAHARVLLTSSPEGATQYLDADVRDPGKILAEAASLLDFTKPIAVMMLGVLGHVLDKENPPGIVRTLVAAVPSGSYLIINDGTNTDETQNQAADDYADTEAVPYILRSPEQIAQYFEGLELLEPGVVSTSLWRPEPTRFGPPAAVDAFCGVARKP